MMLRKRSILAVVFMAGLVAALVLPLTPTFSAGNTVVTPSDQQGWSTADTRPGGAVNFVADATAPAGCGALQLTTDLSVTAKAQYLRAESVPLANVFALSYHTKQVSGPPVADPSYQLITFLTGGTTGFTTLVFEPYQNPSLGLIVPGLWQQWDVDAGLFWSTRTVTCSGGTIVGSAGGPATYTLADINAICPGAEVGGFGVNIGTSNPGYDVYTDLVEFNDTVYDFEPDANCATFENPEGGQFVIGDLVNAAVGSTVNFWGSQWQKNNPMSGGSGPNAFKGFENGNLLPDCGSTWTSRPGNSSNPPATIPQFMPVIVSSSVQKNGSVITGNVERIVIVETNPGYGSNPGHWGTGKVVAVLCTSP
ncbi:MAG TPA: hypothetical protein VNO50_18360 [Pyrinomonadaceae bacterium]|nr:hypothetical protein [Pyrinomonadaceae bacterium]